MQKETEMFGLDTTDVEAAFSLLLSASLKATLLAATVWLTLTLFRVRSATIRHRVWSLMLCSMIPLPLIIHIAPEVAIPIAWMTDSVHDKISITESASVDEAPAETQAQVTTAVSEIPIHEGRGLQDTLQPSSVPLITNDGLSPLVVQFPSEALQHSVATPAATVPRSSWLFAVGVIYAVGVVLLLTRIVVGIVCSVRLVDRARPVSLSSSFDRVPTAARVLESDEVLVPVTLGVWRPAIVLPADWNTWDNSLVKIAVAHEAEHWRRRDTLVGLLTAVNAALYWFHPMVWLLRRHIHELAEQACDDQVIRTTGQRAEYAQVLVDMASRLASGAARYQPAGIGMASKPLVEKRVVRILDDQRPLDVRPGRVRSLLLVSLVAMASIIIAGLSAAPVGVSAQETVAPDDAAQSTTEKSTPAEPQPDVQEPKTHIERIDESASFPVAGQLLNEEGKPVDGAELRLIVTSQKRAFPRDQSSFAWRNILSGQTKRAIIVLQFLSATTNADGRFEFPEVVSSPDIELVWWGEGITRARQSGIASMTPNQQSNLLIKTMEGGNVGGVIDVKKYPDVSDVCLRGRFDVYPGEQPQADGRYEVRNVPSGTYELQFYTPVERTNESLETTFYFKVVKRRPVIVEAGKTLTLDIGADSSTPKKPTAPAEPATSATVRPKRPASMTPVVPVRTPVDDNADVVITGRVTDEAGNGLAGAKLWFPKPPISDDAFETTTDADGHYSLSVPGAATQPEIFKPRWTLWCYAKDRQIGATSTYESVELRSNMPVDMTLHPTSDTGFVVQTTDGKPVPGAYVEPFHFLQNSYEVIPRGLRKLIGAKTDEDGRAMLPAIGRDGFSKVQVTAAGYGVQQLRLKDSADEPAIRTVTLRPTGRLEGRLISHNSELIRNATVYVCQDDYVGEHSAGAAIVETDTNGRFAVPEFAEGRIDIVVSPFQNTSSPFRPRVPRSLQINAGDTTTVEIPYESTVRVRGRVQTKEDSQPVADAMIIVTHGSFQQFEHVRTDADGHFEAYVLPGRVWQQTSPAAEYANWSVEQDTWEQSVNVPGDVETFDLPAVEIIPNQERTGTLLDQDNKPLANVEIVVVRGNRVYDATNTDDKGNFELSLPPSVKIERFKITLDRHQAPIDATVVSETPLVLQIRAD